MSPYVLRAFESGSRSDSIASTCFPSSKRVMPTLWAVMSVGARLDRDRDGLLVFFVGVILLCVAAAVYLLADLLVAATPVVMLASGVAVASVTSNAPRRVVGQWGGAGGAVCEDHFRLAGSVRLAAAAFCVNPI